VCKLFKYARAFGGQDPLLSEESAFRVTGMLPQLADKLAVSQPESGAESQERRILAALLGGPLGKTELAGRLVLPAVSAR
jgi:ATP-dependent DNA helicase RecG